VYGARPVAVVFAREITDGLTSLVKKLDAASAKNKDLGTFVVFLGQEGDLKDKLKDLAKEHNIQNTILTIDNPAGPPKYKIAKDADVTVLFYTQKQVKANHAFKKGELKKSDVETIVKDLGKILPGAK
jgi:hypothetical protein